MAKQLATAAALLALTPGAVLGAGSQQKPTVQDPRLARITKSELIAEINHAPLSSLLAHETLISRAGHSHLIQAAYEQYTAIWEKKQKDANANLLRGQTAMVYWDDNAVASIKSPSNRALKLDLKQQNELMRVAATCLGEAVKLDPKSAAALREDGFYLWQYGNNMKRGLMLVKGAERITPNDPVVHMRLGYIYMNPTGNAYDLQKARQEFECSLRLDPTYAVPHNWLSKLYRAQHKDAAAKRERAAYLALVPAGSDVTGVSADH